MGAGVSPQRKRQILDNVVRRTQRKLQQGGVPVVRRNYALSLGNDSPGGPGGFVITWHWIHASNGEAALLSTVVLTTPDGNKERFDYLTADRGIARIVELFGFNSRPPLDRLRAKLFPGRFTGMSAFLAAILGCILEQEWTTPTIGGLSITSDGYLISGNAFLGSAADLDDNLRRLFDAVGGLAEDEQAAWQEQWNKHVSDWRPKGNAWKRQ